MMKIKIKKGNLMRIMVEIKMKRKGNQMRIMMEIKMKRKGNQMRIQQKKIMGMKALVRRMT